MYFSKEIVNCIIYVFLMSLKLMALGLWNKTLCILFLYYIIGFSLCKNASSDFILPTRSMLFTFDRDSQEHSNQKQYVVRLNAKLLAQERERQEKSLQQKLFNYPSPQKHLSEGYDSYFGTPGKFIGSHLRKIANDELCVTTMQAIYDTLPSVDAVDDSQEILTEIANKLSRKMRDYLSVLEKNKQYIESVFNSNMFLFDTANQPCCGIHPDSLNYDEHFGVDVSLDRGCVTFPYSHFPAGLYIGKNLSAAFKLHFKKIPSLLWQYYISSDGAHFEYPAYQLGYNQHCELKTDRHRQVYQDSVKLKTKNVIIVVDQGNSLSLFQFGSARIIAKYILSLLSPHDKVIVFGLASDVQYAQGNTCSEQKLLYATTETKYELIRYIDSLSKKPNATDHVLGFRHIYEIIRKIDVNNNSAQSEILVTYISRGLLSSLVDAKQVLEIIADGSVMSKSHIVINTYALIDDEKPVMYETDFLQAVADQNFKKYNIHVKKAHEVQKGVMVLVNSTKDISVIIGDIFKAFPDHLSPKPIFSLPYFDPVSKGMVISISQQVYHQDDLMGVTGIDISLTDIAEDTSYFTNSDQLYAFLIDESGITITHPSFSHPTFTNWHHIHTYIWHVEDKPGFQNIYKSILREHSGEVYLPLKTVTSGKKKELSNDRVAVYQWRKVEGTPYIVCVVSIEPAKTQKALKNYLYSDGLHFSYHRLDLLPTSSSCRHMKQLSSLGTTALFLAASCFISPYKYLAEEETRQMVYNYMAYLRDHTKLIANPGLKNAVRNQVLAISQITSAWKTAAEHKEFSNYVVRRFVATRSGVFQVYPATVIDKSYDATRRDWYIHALQHPGKIILTAPYLDVGGAGYVITLSHTVYEGKSAALHSSEDNVVAVMGMDFTFGYFYKFLMDKIPVCKQDHVICFLLDDKGYLVSHPDLIEPAERGPVEQQHITHKEPLVANDLLNHRAFVTKKLCNSYSDRTIQRYYQLNTSLDTILTNLVHGDPCTKYQLMAVHGTNTFLGIVNKTCDGIPAFCPCSMTDRLCLNCHRMEPTECECPCECPLKMDLCSGQLINDSNRYPTCPHFPEQPHLPVIDLNILDALQPCYEPHCSSRMEAEDCIGILGCEWCRLDSDGISPLPKKFCTEQRRCFGGVLGAQTPYADEIVESLPEGEFLTLKSTPVGPVAGAFIIFFIVFAVAVYCYRNHLRSNSSHFGSSIPDEANFRMTQLNNEPDETEPFQEPMNSAPVSHLLPHMEDVVVSPYRVSTNYRRPPGGDSDHGYSTMTPHEDSELAPYFEPHMIGKDRHSIHVPSAHSLSSGSRTSSPVSCVPSTTCSASPSVLKMDCPSMQAKSDFLFGADTKMKGSHVLAHVQVHSENI